MESSNYKLFLGLETHIELNTPQKMFCGCSARYFGAEPNTHTCPVCLGLPGALPVPNFEAIRNTIMIGLALNCKINLESYFERKHYFYADLPKGYQISQYQKPLCYDGYLDIGTKKIRIHRIHLEEDTGKLIHGLQGADPHDSFVDFNRSSVPLVEIVTEPDVETASDATTYLQKLQLIVQYVGLSDCDMEKGSMRCEPNISVSKIQNSKTEIQESAKLPNYKVEVKNINSFKFVQRAIEYEFKRQVEAHEKGKECIQETRRYIESTGKTETMRTKESSEDYRYFPEPDIPPLSFKDQMVEEIKKELNTKEFPETRYKKLTKVYGLHTDIARILVEEKEWGDVFYKLSRTDNQNFPQLAAFIVNQRKQFNPTKSDAIYSSYLQNTQKKEIDPVLIKKVVTEVLLKNEKVVADYKAGKQNAIQFLLGQCMRLLGRNVDSKTVIEELKLNL